MGGLIDWIAKEWAVIAGAPITFAVWCFIAFVLNWGINRILFGHEIKSKNATIELLQAKADGKSTINPPTTKLP